MIDRVDFYVLESGGSVARDVLACRLALKGFEQGLRVYMRTASRSHSAEMDELLWGFSAPAFVPHITVGDYQPGLVNEGTGFPVEVLIGESAAPDEYCDMLVSLVDEVPDDADVFGRVVDLIAGDDQQKQLGRARYRAYRDRGVVPEIHNL